MKRKALSLLLFCCTVGVASAEPISPSPLATTEVVAWLTAGISTARLVRLVHERGLAVALSEDETRQVAAAGAGKDLVRALTQIKSVGVYATTTPLSKPLLQAARDARSERYQEAAIHLRTALRLDPNNAALHFALAAMFSRQEQWDDAYDELTTSAKLLPDFPENHNAFAYVFCRLNDGPNGIAEARTALSMDPQNAEAYRYLGTALQLNEQYAAAAHAFAESLARDPHNPDTYYQLGMALQSEGKLPAAEAAYRHAVRLRSGSWQANSSLAPRPNRKGKLDKIR